MTHEEASSEASRKAKAMNLDRKKPTMLGRGVEERYPFSRKKHYGVAVVAGTWYATSGIAAGYARGATVRKLAREYGLKVSQIENALRYELALATAS